MNDLGIQNIDHNLFGKINYFSVNNWLEHRMPSLSSLPLMMRIYNFLECAHSNYSACLIVSM